MNLAELTWPDVDALARHTPIIFPVAASAEKGEALLRTFTQGAVALIERMIAWDGTSWNG